MIDSSESIEENFREQVNFARRVVDNINVHPDAVRVAVITYASRPTLDFDFKQYDSNDLVRQGLLGLRSKNTTTRTDLALQMVLEVFNSGEQKGELATLSDLSHLSRHTWKVTRVTVPKSSAKCNCLTRAKRPFLECICLFSPFPQECATRAYLKWPSSSRMDVLNAIRRTTPKN